jgi:ribosomal protein S18 acetylase RimI-like enzyme
MDEHAIEIHRIYVLEEYQGKKVGQILFNQVLTIAHQSQVKYIWLGVWEGITKRLDFMLKWIYRI